MFVRTYTNTASPQLDGSSSGIATSRIGWKKALRAMETTN
jgi:hypothetical protein